MPDRAQFGAFSAREWIERTIRPLPRGGRILDLGCGGGEPIARFLIDQGFSVTGVDTAGSQIDLARTRFPRERWIKADMRTVALDEYFDAVIAWDSVSCLNQADQSLMATRAAEWLKRGGRLLVNTDPDPQTTPADHETTNFTLAIGRQGLNVVAHAAQDPTCGGADVWLARKP